ncbi:glycoside hydrolase family 13 protein [Cochleicola gelatinilyticus]|uniref:Alpha-amlyase n=1 Tax=Cochleicola gelatinilyticus TaxID=1763537 RepID=A0A167HKH6_9FLAO|nr:glycoside hydrolase family 13 protein [Cochleicola gelatinilyticus]OAB78708.1 alpha-amlyase [Cochleicola gelatinilyticus]
MNYYITFLIVCISSTVFAQIDRLEPPFWWAGMEHNEVQLVCYGNNIAAYEVASEDLKILEVKKVENPNYLFITIDSKDKAAGTYSLYFDNGKNQPFRRNYELKTRTANSAQREGFDSSDVIYLLMPDRFANGDSSNDSTSNTVEKVDRSKNGGRHGGDITGIINNLDYLEDLGVTALWSTPLLEDNEPTYSYHTYAQSDYYKIDPRFGSNEDYKELADNMHKRDMKLIMDYVTNHWGSKHWMIQDLPMEDWIHYWEDGDRSGFKRSNYRMTTQFDGNASAIDAQGCMDGWFDTTMPDMNQANPLVLNYMVQNAIWWIEYAGLDGFRVDTYSYNNKEAIATWTKAIMNEYPNFNIMGEIWMHDQAQISYWQKDSKIGAIDNFNSGLPTVMDFTLHDAISAMFNEDPAWDKGFIRAYDNFTNDFLYPDTNNLLVFAGNHDTNRINEIYKSDLDTYKQIMTLIFTVRGIPQIYYGDEIGMTGNKETLGDGDIRRDFPGGWSGDAQNAFTQQGRTESQNAYHNFTKKLLNWRKEKEVMHTGEFLHYIPFDDVYVYFRYNDAERVMVVLNNTSEEKTIALDRFSEGLNGATSGYNIISETKITFSETMTVPAKGSMIIELK